jgi:hypothetical protein
MKPLNKMQRELDKAYRTLDKAIKNVDFSKEFEMNEYINMLKDEMEILEYETNTPIVQKRTRKRRV